MLWFKRNYGHELTFRQKVGLTKNTVGSNVFSGRMLARH